MDLKELKEKHPDIYQAAFDEGHAAGKTVGYQDGEAAGIQKTADEAAKAAADAERERIQAVEKCCIAGHEALIETLKYDGKTSGPEAALQILQAEQAIRKQKADEFAAGGPTPVDESSQESAKVATPRIMKDARAEIDRRAHAKIEEAKTAGKELTYRQALVAVMQEDPALAAEYEGRE